MVALSKDKVSQEQLYDMLLSRELSWQEIIIGLIASEQLDPWDIDIASLASRYLDRIKKLEEANFFISSKVLLAASLLLRIKSEMLLTKYLKSLDEVLFGKPEQKKENPSEPFIFREILPELVPKTPLPRLKKVTLYELMNALERAINTEHRRIRKEITAREMERNVNIVLPRTRIDIRKKIQEVYARIKEYFRKNEEHKLAFSILAGAEKPERIATFLPLLYLETQSKIMLEQQNHFEEIYIWLQKKLSQHGEGIPEMSSTLVQEYESESNDEDIMAETTLPEASEQALPM